MKNKLRNEINVINYISSTEKFKLIFIISIIMAAYGSFVLGISGKGFFDSAIIAFQFPIFNIMLMSMIIFNTLNTCSTFNKKMSFYIIRLRDKKNYIKTLIRYVVYVNLFYVLMFLVIYFAFILLFKGFNLNLISYKNYDINYLIYSLFYFSRYILLSLLISVVVSLIYLNCKFVISILVNLFFLFGFVVFNVQAVPKESVDLNVWKFFTSETFGNLSLEITSILIVLAIIEIIIILLYNYTINNKKMVIT